jgi:uncharacterized phage protein (TIGR02220 family)
MIKLKKNPLEIQSQIGVDAFSMLFAIAQHVNTRTGNAWPGIKRLCSYCKVMTRDGELKAMPEKRGYLAIKTLVDNGYISKYQQRTKSGDFGKVIYKIKTDAIAIWIEYENPEFEEDSRLVENGEAINDQQNDTKEKEHIVEKLKVSTDDVKKVVDILNQESGARYRHTTKSTRIHIAARLKEGFTVDDFEKVIIHKAAEWKGTPNEKYLRPNTLFAGKFEGYLQAAESIERKKAEESISDELKDGYNAYLTWIQKDFPSLTARVQYLSKNEYESYHKDNYLKNLSRIGRTKKRTVLQQCHEQFANNPQIERNYSTVWGYYCQQIKQHIKTASVC